MGELEMPGNDRQDVKDKYMAIRYDFLIGFKDEYGGVYGKLFSGEFIWPVSSCHAVSSPYGMRLHPIKGTYCMHYGLDISTSE